jgi:UDP-N-acetylmuramoyl-tripeptide--D-alanyl-D-alanine ligase
VWTVTRIAEIVEGQLHRPADPLQQVTGFSIDSRTLRRGEFFIALPGERTDGHLYIADAFRKGASGALVQRLPRELADAGVEVCNCIEVPDTRQALQQLAAVYRQELTIPIVGITGSSGKTTTKELLYALLSRKYRAYRSPGNYNTEIGLPLALLAMPPETETGVFELALQRPGDIKLLAHIARPTLGIITAIGEAHLGFFPNREALAREKWALIERLPAGGWAILNADAPYLSSWACALPARGVRVVPFGLRNPDAVVKAQGICEDLPDGLTFTICAFEERFAVRTRLLGRANAYNILAAVTAARLLGVEVEHIREALEAFRPVPRRLELKRSERFGLVLDDSYNANPTAVREALYTLARLRFQPPRRKVFVFGDMLELGDRAVELHREIAEVIAELKVDLVFAIGDLAGETARVLKERYSWKPEHVYTAQTRDELLKQLEQTLPDERNAILVKGSRGMALDVLVDALV